MPEIAEIHRICHFLRQHAVGRTITSVLTQDDAIVYGKVGTSAAAFQAAMAGKKIVDVGQQGKYFWLCMSAPPHPVMHFGMTGWIELSNVDTGYYRSKKKEKPWPPKFWKFVLELDGGVKVAFDDARRLARIRLVDGEAGQLRKMSPLKENGPDPVRDKSVFTEEWLGKKLRSKKVPVKALLLDQGNISGIGNWVADEVLYQSKIHPEQYSNTLSDAQVHRLHESIDYVCTTACDLLAESDNFPKHWLMKHRWSKGKSGGNTLPTGEKIIFLTVGGRTSAVVPSVQKKSGDVSAAAVEAEKEAIAKAEENDGEGKVESKAKVKAEPKKKGAKRGRNVKDEDEDEEEVEDEEEEKPTKKVAKGKTNGVKEEITTKKAKAETPAKKVKTEEAPAGRRRSGRIAK